jgi:hypothetical protein
MKNKEKLNGPLKDIKFQHDWANDYEALRYSYLSTLLPLKKQEKDLEEQEADLARRRAQMFPQSKEDFKTKPADVKLRAARFLIADRARQERMLTEYGWAWRQVKALQDAFAKDVRVPSLFFGVGVLSDFLLFARISLGRRYRPWSLQLTHRFGIPESGLLCESPHGTY